MNKIKRGFTLLEVLVAGGILFIVSAAVVGLSNSIIQGTVTNNDITITNRWASEGLELATKIRDEKSKNSGFSTGQGLWFGDSDKFSSPIQDYTSVSNYGWYYLATSNNLDWRLRPVPAEYKNVIDLTTFNPDDFSGSINKLIADNLEGYRFVCVESVGAVSTRANDETKIRCNTDGNSDTGISDGDRLVGADCDATDLYCRLTKVSLRRVSDKSQYIPDGNAVKVRSTVTWNSRGTYKYTEIGTLLTNWKSLDN